MFVYILIIQAFFLLQHIQTDTEYLPACLKVMHLLYNYILFVDFRVYNQGIMDQIGCELLFPCYLMTCYKLQSLYSAKRLFVVNSEMGRK